MYVCGRGEGGQLGLGDSLDRDRPTRVAGLSRARICMAAAGGLHSAAVSDDGALWTWGHGGYGQLGHGQRENSKVPRLVAALNGRRVRMAAAGRAHTVCVTIDGLVYAWGSGGLLGRENEDDCASPAPLDLASFGGSRVVFVACGRDYTCAVTEQSPQILAASRSPGGALYSWGRNPDGVLGLNHDRDCLVPTPVDALTGWEVVLVACGVSHSAAVTDGGLLFVWGSGEHGRLGLGDTERRLVPTQVPRCSLGAADARVAVAALGGKHSVALTDSGALFTWGYGDFGRLGHGDTATRLVPTLVKTNLAAALQRGAMAACGASHTSVVTACGLLYTFGDAESAQLGHGGREQMLVPTLVAPALLGGACVGRCRRLPTDHSLAFCMVSHGRLGAQSTFACLLPELVRGVVEHAHVLLPGARDDGLQRLLGGRASPLMYAVSEWTSWKSWTEQ